MEKFNLLLSIAFVAIFSFACSTNNDASLSENKLNKIAHSDEFMLVNSTLDQFMDLGREAQSQLTEEELNTLGALYEQHQTTLDPKFEEMIVSLIEESGISQELISKSETILKKFEQDITNVSNTFGVSNTQIYDEIEYLVLNSYVLPISSENPLTRSSGCIDGCTNTFVTTSSRIYNDARAESVIIAVSACTGPVGDGIAVVSTAILFWQVDRDMDIARGVRDSCIANC